MQFPYTTEYQRSFANKNWYSAGINKLNKDNNNPTQVRTPTTNSAFTEKCSVGIQANVDTKRVHFEPEPVQPQETSRVSTNEPSDMIFEPRRVSAKQSIEEKLIEKEEPIHFKKSEQNLLPLHVDNRPSIYPLDLRAGNHSENYHRSAFISKKKKVFDNPSNSDLAVYRVSSEPCLQKKRITMYPKNHNILRTFTVKEEDSPHSSKGYVSSYRTDFDDRTFKFCSPVMNALYSMNRKNSSSSIQSVFSNDFEDSHRFYKKDYEHSDYETEYQKFCSRRSSEENIRSPLLEAVQDDNEFSNYYKQVLTKRIHAYSPALQDLTRPRDSRNQREKQSYDEHESEKSMSPTRTQRYVKGRYTREYEPDHYSPR